MTDPYFNLPGLPSEFQTAYEPVMYGSRLSLNDCLPKNAIAFGQQVKQTSPNDYLKTPVPDEHGYPNQFSYSRFRVETSGNLPPSTSESSDGGEASGAAGHFFTSPPDHMPITILDSEEPRQGEASDVSVKPEKANSSSESEIKIVQVWSMAVEEGSHFVNNSHQNSNIQTSPIIQADNLANEFARRCCTQNDDKIRFQRIHSGEKPYKCKDCDKCFAQTGDLLVHRRKHTGNRPYQCQRCVKSFVQKCDLNVHQRIHMAEKSHECKECGKRFEKKRSLQTHQRVHSGQMVYSCPLCDEVFARRFYLRQHQRIHTGIRPFVCCQCDKSYTRKSHLKVHQRVHQGIHAGKSLLGASSATKSLPLEQTPESK